MPVPTVHRVLARAALILILALVAAPGQAQEPEAPKEGEPAASFDPGTPHPDAPEELALFGRLAGAWDAEMSIIQDDGTFPETPTSALWTFRYILDGHAVQDHWTSPAPDDPVGDDPRQFGTGLRVYNPAEDHWEMAWISTSQPFVTTFEAHPHGDGGIVMMGEHPTGHPSRTTFYEVKDDSFSWKLELQGLGEDPDAWIEVARIRAVRRE
jgi:hypothetical protein